MAALTLPGSPPMPLANGLRQVRPRTGSSGTVCGLRTATAQNPPEHPEIRE